MPNVTVYDLENYPDNGKTVTVNLASLVPVGQEGDNKWVISSSTNGYSNITSRTAIQNLYVQDIRAGWERSSGLKGSSFTIGASNKTLGIKMDAVSSTYYLELDTGSNLPGATVAADMEEKIRAIPDTGFWQTADDGFKLAYMNSSVEFTNNKFTVVAGSMGSYYTGADRTSVEITVSGSDTAYVDLGFNLGLSSMDMVSLIPKEVALSSSYTTNTTPMVIGDGTGVVAGDALYITDGTDYDYFTALSGTTDTNVVVAVSGTNNFIGVTHTYTAGAAKIQLMMPGDPETVPTPYYQDVDAIVRFGIKTMANQLDYSS